MRVVPFVVPSVTHNSWPVRPSEAEKYTLSFHWVKDCAQEPAKGVARLTCWSVAELVSKDQSIVPVPLEAPKYNRLPRAVRAFGPGLAYVPTLISLRLLPS